MIYPTNYSLFICGGVVFSLENLDQHTIDFKNRIRSLLILLKRYDRENTKNVKIDLDVNDFHDLLIAMQMGMLNHFIPQLNKDIVIHLNPYIILDKELPFCNIIHEFGGRYILRIGTVNINVDVTTSSNTQYKNIYLLISSTQSITVQYFLHKKDIEKVVGDKHILFISCKEFITKNNSVYR